MEKWLSQAGNSELRGGNFGGRTPESQERKAQGRGETESGDSSWCKNPRHRRNHSNKEGPQGSGAGFHRYDSVNASNSARAAQEETRKTDTAQRNPDGQELSQHGSSRA